MHLSDSFRIQTKLFSVWIIVLCGLFVHVAGSSRSVSIPIYIEDRLNAGRMVYDKQSTPTQIEGVPTIVNLTMYIEGISSFRTQTMDFQLDVYFQQYWRDPRLAHNETKRILIRDPDILQKMWRPDVYFANSRIAEFHDVTQANFLLWIEPDGSILYDTRVSMVVICAMQLHHYPMDSQWCNLRMLSYAYDQDQLIIAWMEVDPITRNPNITLPDMNIARLDPGICDGNYSTGVWSCVTAEFFENFLRNRSFYGRQAFLQTIVISMFYIMQTYVPTSLIVIISWFSFWLGLDQEAVPARVSLAITTLLTLSTQANSVRTTLPEVSYMRSIDIFLTISVLFVFGVMIEFVVTNYTQRKARLAAEEADLKQGSGNKNQNAGKKIGTRARNILNRIFRTGTELRNLIEHHELNGDVAPTGTQEIPLRQRSTRAKSAYWATGNTSPSAADDGSSIGSWASIRRQRNRVVAQVAVANGQPQLITSQPQAPPGYEQQWREREGERLANWTRPELSCDGLMENTAAPAATPPNIPLSWAQRTLAQRLRSAPITEEATIVNGAEPPSPRSQGSSTMKWSTVANAVRQIQRNKKEFGKMQAKKIDEWSRWVFPLSYFSFHLVYWWYYLVYAGSARKTT